MKNNNNKSKSRRSFVKKIAGTAAATSFFPSIISLGKSSPNIIPLKKRRYSAIDKINVGAIGMGIMGFNNVQTTVTVPGVELIAACDLYEGHLTKVKEQYGDHIKTTRDYREILSNPDIDAVIISTPDHWHDKISIEAMKSGKDVYCEKPMVHHIDEGKAVIDTEKKTGKVFQVGSQGVSSIVYEKAAEIYKSGAIGQLILVETYNDRQSANGAWQYSIPPDASEKTIDWDTFLGDAPKRPYDPVRFFRWRNYQDYGTGVAGDLFVHLFSGLHVVVNSYGPERIYASGGLRYWKDGRDVPDVMLAVVDYPETSEHSGFNLQIRVNFVDGNGGGSILRLVGSEGSMTIGWSTISVKKSVMPVEPGYGGWDTYETFPEATQKEFVKWYNEKYPTTKLHMQEPEELVYSAPEGYSSDYDHHNTFYEAIRNGTRVTEDASFGLRAAGPSLSMNISYFEKRIVSWDPVNMTVK